MRQLRTFFPQNQKKRPDLSLLSIVREKGVILRDVEDKEANHNFIPDDPSGYIAWQSKFLIMFRCSVPAL